jgi:hypothetical protein
LSPRAAPAALGDAKQERASKQACSMPNQTVNSVIERHAGEIVSLPGVVGIAEGEARGRSCIRVFVVRRTEHLSNSIPRELDGWPVIVEETGELSALKEDHDARDEKVDC